MAYVASWIAPMGSVMGAKNWEQKPRNMDNINQTFVKNETEGYYKPPFCQWPFGGSSKKEAKFRIRYGEPIVKAGSYEYGGNDFYYGTGKFIRPKDEDEISIRTESTTLYMQSNLCTRTYGPNKKPKRLPGTCHRAQYHRRPVPKVYKLTDEMKEALNTPNVNIFDTITYDINKSDETGPLTAEGTAFMTSKEAAGLMERSSKEGDIRPSTPRHVRDCVEEIPARRHQSLPRFANPRTYKAGEVPRMKDREEDAQEPVWRGLSKSASQMLVSPRTYLSAHKRVSKGRRPVEDLYGANDRVLYFD